MDGGKLTLPFTPMGREQIRAVAKRREAEAERLCECRTPDECCDLGEPWCRLSKQPEEAAA